jgi:hypothetical protein
MISQKPRLRAEREWAEYGLEKPEIQVRLEFQKRNAAELLLGIQAPVGRAVFAKWSEERGYFLIAPEMKAVFHQSVYGLREKRLFRLPVSEYRKISVGMGGCSYQWKRDDASWVWMEPVSKFGQKIPDAQMVLILQAIQGLHVKEFLDNTKQSKAELGFFMIHDLIRDDCEGGKQEAFYFGNEVAERNAYYGLLEGDGTVFLLDRGKVIDFFDLMKKIQDEAK